MNLQITSPVLFLDPMVCRRNLARMVHKIKTEGIRFRPHFKTHQSRKIGDWFREAGVEAITVSSLGMARYFVGAGWKDITLAIPFNPSAADEINSLASAISLHLVTGSADSILKLGPELRFPVNIWIKYDAGNHRSGVNPEDSISIDKIISACSMFPLISLKGFLGHAGQSYQSKTREEILAVHEFSIQTATALREKYGSKIEGLQISLGDTPTCSLANHWPGVNELRPGNFIFYDWMQAEIGSCEWSDIAVVMACPVIDVKPDKGVVVVHGGAVHFSKDSVRNENGAPVFGILAEKEVNGWRPTMEKGWLKSLSQEHGILQTSATQASRYHPGDIVYFFPVHSCLTAECMRHYRDMEGNLYDHFDQMGTGS